MSTFSSWVASFVERELLFNIGQKPKLNARFEAEILSKNDLHFREKRQFAIKKRGYGTHISIFRIPFMSPTHRRKMEIGTVRMNKCRFSDLAIL